MEKIYSEIINAAKFINIAHDADRIRESLTLFDDEFSNGLVQLRATSRKQFNYRCGIDYSEKSLKKMVDANAARCSEIGEIVKACDLSMVGADFDPFGKLVKQWLSFPRRGCRLGDLPRNPLISCGIHTLPDCIEHLSVVGFDVEKNSTNYYFSPWRKRPVDWRSIVAHFGMRVPERFQRDSFISGASGLAVTVTSANEIKRVCLYVPCCMPPDVPDELVDIYLYASNKERSYFIDFSFGKDGHDFYTKIEWEIQGSIINNYLLELSGVAPR